MRREEVVWRGLRAVRYAAGGTSTVVVPERGAKVVSLRDASGREWLTQGDGRAPAPRGTSFERAEMCGWDECVPTIERAVTMQGSVAADHGDAWDAAWEEVAPDRVAIDVPSVGVRFERGVAVGEDGVVTFSYLATAGRRAAAVLWAAHPLFRAGEGDRVTVDAVAPLWSVDGDAAEPAMRDGDALLNAPRVPGAMAKYYTDPEERPRWARIDRADGGGLLLSWEGAAIRTVGVWIDRSGLAAEDVVALEPSTGWYDSLSRAERAGRVLRLDAGASAGWSVSVTPILT